MYKLLAISSWIVIFWPAFETERLLFSGKKVVGRNCGWIFWPTIPFVFHLVVFAWFLSIGLYIRSSGLNSVVNVDAKPCNEKCSTNPITNKPFEIGNYSSILCHIHMLCSKFLNMIKRFWTWSKKFQHVGIFFDMYNNLNVV